MALTGLAPSVDFALVALRRHLQLPTGSAFGLFALGRCAGWLAQALEQRATRQIIRPRAARSEEHTSELQSPCNLVCRLLLEKKKKKHDCTCNCAERHS